jgi:hypothetical protein
MSLPSDGDDEQSAEELATPPSSWQTVFHATGWRSDAPTARPILDANGLQSESNKTTLKLSYELLQAGKLAQPNTTSIKRSVTKTPSDIQNPEQLLEL